jgi:hypothetical protein
MEGSYLSIDLDFWMHKDKRSSNPFFKRVFYYVREFGIPLHFVIEHEELLDDINSCENTKTLYNVDFHSDLCADIEIDVDENATDGTWGNFVNWRFDSEFVWICPDYADCYMNESGVCCTDKKHDPFRKNTTGWQRTKVTDRLKIINWNSIERIGVCLSPLFVNEHSVEDVLYQFNISKERIKILLNQPVEHEYRKRGTLRQFVGV